MNDDLADNHNWIMYFYLQVRQVVMNLRERLSEANEETKSLAKTKQILERCLEHMIKVSKSRLELPAPINHFFSFQDSQINKQTTKLRAHKPQRELIPDQADSMLELEREVR